MRILIAIFASFTCQKSTEWAILSDRILDKVQLNYRYLYPSKSQLSRGLPSRSQEFRRSFGNFNCNLCFVYIRKVNLVDNSKRQNLRQGPIKSPLPTPIEVPAFEGHFGRSIRELQPANRRQPRFIHLGETEAASHLCPRWPLCYSNHNRRYAREAEVIATVNND